MSVTVRFVGSGDSFGSGGRFQTCILIEAPGSKVALDCGASSLVAMRAQGVDPNDVATILLTHLHGDHCAGVPFLIMDAMLGAKRTSPLTVAGPAGLRDHLEALRELLFPGSSAMCPKFPVEYVQLQPFATCSIADVQVTAYPAVHTPETSPLMLRVALAGKVITYTGDTDWSEDIVTAADNADLFISECYFYDKPVKMHMNYVTFAKRRARLTAKTIVLTHMSPEMLRRSAEIDERCAHDAMVIEL